MNSPLCDDIAWVTIETPFTPEEGMAFIEDLERLFRINSLLQINRWQQVAEDRIDFDATNISNGKHIQTQLKVERIDHGLKVNYQNQLKTFTCFQIEPGESGLGDLIITDDYSGNEESERKNRLDEVDRSLNRWGEDIYGYMQHWHRWSWLVPWRWYMQEVWQPMKPKARRITNLILWITGAEMAVILLIVVLLAFKS